jgi:hypothetical protein
MTRSTLVHPVVTLLLSLLEDQLASLPLQPLLTSRQIQEVSVRPLHIGDLDFLRSPLFTDHVRRGDEIQCVSEIRLPRDGGESLESVLA